MSILVCGRPSVESRGKGRGTAPSVREVCLLGVQQAEASWAHGERLEWGGRVYRVSATQARDEMQSGPIRYLHLTASEQSGPVRQSV